MKILDSNYPTYKLTPLIGEQIKGFEKKGSTAYFIKKIQTNSPLEQSNNLVNFKGIFERYSNGLLLRIFKSNKIYSIPINKNSIRRIVLIEGDEEIDPIPLFPMWILLHIGVPVLIARYFRIRLSEYQKEETKLLISTEDFVMELITNGYTFNSQMRFFEQLDLGLRLEIEKASA